MKNFFRSTGLLLTAFLISQNAFAQVRLGLRLDNYQGINAAFINPANTATQRLNWNFNIVSAGIFTDTDYGFLENSSFSDALNKTWVNRDEIGPDGMVDLNEFAVLDFNNTDSEKYFEVNGFVTGPSLFGHLGNSHLGVFVNYRFHGSEQNLDADLGYYTNQRIPLTDSIALDRTQLSTAAWREIGFHYAHSIDQSWGEISIGTNLKYISGIEGFSLETTTAAELRRLSLDDVSVDNLSIRAMGTTGLIDQNNLGSASTGSGYGFDVGVNLMFEDTDNDYKLRLGIAVNDIGSITFDQNVEAHVLQSTLPTTFSKPDFLDIADLRDLINRTSTTVTGVANGSLDPAITSFDIGLPTAVVLNADYRVTNRIYVGALMVQRFPKANVSLERSNLLAISPRYESKWIGAAAPVSMINYGKMNVGASVRLAFLTIGTDQLMSFTKRDRLSGGDVYMSLQFFGLNEDGIFNRLFQKKGGTKAEKCYEM